jgi:hypothetical protein
VASIAFPNDALPLVTTLPAIQAGIETMIHTTNSVTAIANISRSVTSLGNKDEDIEIISEWRIRRLYYKILALLIICQLQMPTGLSRARLKKQEEQ